MTPLLLAQEARPFVEGDLSTRGHVFIVAITAGALIVVLRLVRRRRMAGRYAVLWSAVGAVLLVLAAWPASLSAASELVGIHYPPTLLLVGLVGFLLVVTVHLSYEMTRVEDRTRTLAEEIALLRAERELERAASDDDASATADDAF